MFLKEFNDLPNEFLDDNVLTYYKILKTKKASLAAKRITDIFLSLVLIILLSPIMVFIAICIKIDSPGAVIFRQERVTTYGKIFKIYKFRTMYTGAEKGSQVTVNNDSRITKVGNIIRKFRLDELLQLFNVIKGDMSFVGTRPEVKKYVIHYTSEMTATLLLPAGITSLASINYKDEDELLADSSNADETYINEIMPAKMKYNLEYIKHFSFLNDFKIMIMTFLAVFTKNKGNKKTIKELEKHH